MGDFCKPPNKLLSVASSILGQKVGIFDFLGGMCACILGYFGGHWYVGFILGWACSKLHSCNLVGFRGDLTFSLSHPLSHTQKESFGDF